MAAAAASVGRIRIDRLVQQQLDDEMVPNRAERGQQLAIKYAEAENLYVRTRMAAQNALSTGPGKTQDELAEEFYLNKAVFIQAVLDHEATQTPQYSGMTRVNRAVQLSGLLVRVEQYKPDMRVFLVEEGTGRLVEASEQGKQEQDCVIC